MSARQWKPGDVAMVRTREHGHRVSLRTSTPTDGRLSEFFNTAGFSYATEDQVRPLVVIDPEDREQIERLRQGIFMAFRDDGRAMGGYDDPRLSDLLQAALRSLTADPKPEEPTGLGAVVKDADGDKWVWLSNGADGAHWHRVGIPEKRANWSQIAAVKVLSEGVTP